MSGRSAYVRKQKTRIRHGDDSSQYKRDTTPVLDGPVPPGQQNSFEYAPSTIPSKSTKSITSVNSDDMAYARVRKPVLPPLDKSGIEKSSFREMMDKKSEGVRRGLAGMGFGKKKKKPEPVPESRPHTSNTVRPIPYDQETVIYDPSPLGRQQNGGHRREKSEDTRVGPAHAGPPNGGPPHGKLPPLPPAAQLKRWQGAGRPPHPWNKLRKDPEIWDPNGDTLIYLAQQLHTAARPPPSFRVSSHVLEATESKYFARMLREGYTDAYSDTEVPPSPISSAGGYFRSNGPRSFPRRLPSSRQPSPPISDNGKSEYAKSEYAVSAAASEYGRSEYVPSEYQKSEYAPSTIYGSTTRRPRTRGQDPDGQIAYELYFPAPINQSKADSLRYHAATRNVFALLYQASFVGLNLLQALTDLHERLRMYMPPEADSSELIIDYITNKRIDDPRNDPSTALSLLIWSEGKNVRWREGWREFFVHCVGMFSRLDTAPEYRLLSGITKALLERASLEMEVRLSAVGDRLVDFNFSDMWPVTQLQPQLERLSFERLRQFLRGFYEASCGSWPPAAPTADDSWLTKELVKRLQADFGALYDYLVNREVIWESSEERSSRKWNIISANPEKNLLVDTIDLPLTDMLVAFDSRNRYPHVPNPYPLVPDSMPVMSRETLYKASKKMAKPITAPEDKIAERKIALAYTEATNIYILGPDFVSNKLADAFIRFEKADRPSEVDPFAARRGRWVLVYGILQTLASVSVDTPGLRYKEDVAYHLNASLRGTPPWKTNIPNQPTDEASHEGSYCWLAPRAWEASESEVPMLDSLSISPATTPFEKPARLNISLPSVSIRSSLATSVTGSDIGSMRSTSVLSRKTASGKPLRWIPRGMVKEIEGMPGGYGPGIKRIGEWPIREESRGHSYDGSETDVKEYQNGYKF